MKYLLFLMMGVFLSSTFAQEKTYRLYLDFKLKDLVAVPDSVNWIDSVRYVDKINWIDSLRIRDSLAIRDSLVIKDSIRFVDGPGKEIIEIPINNIRLDSIHDNFEVRNLTDGELFHSRSDRGTRWAVSGYPHQAMLDFGEIYVITEIWFNVFSWNEGYTHDIDIYAWGDKYASITTDTLLWSKHKLHITSSHLLFEVMSGMNSWTDIGEIKIFGYKH